MGKWRYFEVVATPADGPKQAWASLTEQYPELVRLGEKDIRIDVTCRRDGVSRIRFTVPVAPMPQDPMRVNTPDDPPIEADCGCFEAVGGSAFLAADGMTL